MKEKKYISWPFWIQFLTVAALTMTIITLDSRHPVMRHILLDVLSFELKGEWGMAKIPVPVVMCLPAGIIGLAMNFKMKKFRIATIILSLVNITGFILMLLFYFIVDILAGALL